MTIIYVATDARDDLHNCGERNTEASRAEFARAYNVAAQTYARAAGVEIVVDATGDASKAADWRGRNRRAGLISAADADEDFDIPADVWQSLHDCVHTPRAGRWSADRKLAAKRGATLKVELAKMGLLSE